MVLVSTVKRASYVLLQAVLYVFWMNILGLWVLHYVLSHFLAFLRLEPIHPPTTNKDQATRTVVEDLRRQLEGMKKSDHNKGCCVTLLQKQNSKLSAEVSQLHRSLHIKEAEVKAYKNMFDGDFSTPPSRGYKGSTSIDGVRTPEPSTPDDPQYLSLRPGGFSPSVSTNQLGGGSSPRSSSAGQIARNWDWDDLLTEMQPTSEPSNLSIPDINVDATVASPSYQPPPLDLDSEVSYSHLTPREFLCPLSLKLITDPVVAPSGVTYHRHSILQYLTTQHSDPASGAPLLPTQLYPNIALRDLIQKWMIEQQDSAGGLMAMESGELSS